MYPKWIDRNLAFWELPKPKKGKEREWHVVARMSTLRVPFGYKVHPDNPRLLEPIPLELEALELAKKHLKQYSFKEVAAWLSTQTGRSISDEGLRKRVQIDRRRKRAASIKRHVARRLAETLAEIEKLEKNSIGAYTIHDPEED